jgi:hypothetical protein
MYLVLDILDCCENIPKSKANNLVELLRISRQFGIPKLEEYCLTNDAGIIPALTQNGLLDIPSLGTRVREVSLQELYGYIFAVIS